MTHRANFDELEGLGCSLQAQIEIVNKIIAVVDSPLKSIVWTGLAKDAFTTERVTNFKGALASSTRRSALPGRTARIGRPTSERCSATVADGAGRAGDRAGHLTCRCDPLKPTYRTV